MRYFLFFLFVGIVCPGFARAAEPQTLILDVVSPKESFKVGEPISIALVFKNAGPEGLKVYQPPSFDFVTRDGHFFFLVVRPDGSRFRLAPVAPAGFYAPRREDYRDLAPGAAFNVPVAWSDSGAGGAQNISWEALRQISSREAGLDRAQLAQQFNLKGDYFIRRADGLDYLVLKDLSADVFDLPGEYILIAEYANNATFCISDDTRSTMRNWEKIENAWVGTVTGQARLSIVS